MFRACCILLSLCILDGCSRGTTALPAGHDGGNRARIDTETYVFECQADVSIVARIEPEKAWLFIPGTTLRLPLVRSTPDARQYASDSDALSISGDKASITTSTGSWSGCINNRARAIWEHAKLNGVDFRATGNEPGWYLEISGGSGILLVTDYGQARHHFKSASVEPVAQHSTTTYTADNRDHRLKVIVSADNCRDSMSGESFPAKVSVFLDGRHLVGCGRALH